MIQADPTTSAPPLAAQQLIESATREGEALLFSADESWLQGRSLYGGIQIALAMRAAREFGQTEAPIRSLHATFVGPVSHDAPVQARAEALRQGRSVTQVHAALWQGERRCFESIAVFGAARESELSFDSDHASQRDPARAQRLPLIPGLTPNCIQHYDMRWASGSPPFSGTREPRATIFARPAAEITFTETEFLALTDVVPPAVLPMMTKPVATSSMNCALELIRPERVYGTRQFLRFEVDLHDTHSGYGWQTVQIYDEAGALLAISHQSVAVFG